MKKGNLENIHFANENDSKLLTADKDNRKTINARKTNENRTTNYQKTHKQHKTNKNENHNQTKK